MQTKLFSLIALVLSATQARAIKLAPSLEPGMLVMSIDKITDLSNQTNTVLVSAPGPSVVRVMPRVITNFNTIVAMASDDAKMLEGAGDPMFPVDGQHQVCDAFITFVKVHQALLVTVIGKRGVLASTPFTAQVAKVLRAVESVVDTVAFDIIALVPSCAGDADMAKRDLDGTLGDAIKAYTP